MAKSKVESEQERRIRLEYNRLKKSFKKLSDVNMSIVDSLIRRAAFMRISLEDMEEDLLVNGSVEMFTQSEKTEPYERERPVARQYNSMNNNYQKIIKELTSHLPKEVKEAYDDPKDIMHTFIDRRTG